MSFADHFSTQAAGYARYRPTYPPALFAWLASLPSGRERAWDAATGNGQAAVGLAPRFREVIATDASRRQIAHARAVEGVRYAVAAAEASGLAGGSVDLVTVAQAYHWFDHARFLAEVRRVARPGAVLAVWTYGLARVTAAVDAVVDAFYGETMAPYWPAERRHVDAGYATLPFPAPGLDAPAFEVARDVALDDVIGYLGTWSAVARCRVDTGRDPLDDLLPRLASAWGPPGTHRRAVWPIVVRAARVDGVRTRRS